MSTRRKYLKQLSAISLTSLAAAHQPPHSAITLRDDGPTVLMGAAAMLTGGLRTKPNVSGFDTFHVSDWTQPSDSFTWRVHVPVAGEYEAVALILGKDATVQFGSEYGGNPPPQRVDTGWNRVVLGKLHLLRGSQTIRLSAPQSGGGLQLYSVELANSQLTRRLLQQAHAMRSDTSWMRRAKYGLQFHWTSQSQPRTGPHKPYAEAVRDFPARTFAEMVHEAGAGYVILTTSHAEYYFPAPIAAIDATLPGRTSSRDLVRDLISELGHYGIRLMLYYHPGHDDWRDPAGWWARSGYDPVNPEKFLTNWCSIIGEVGARYGDGLAGWFFDDGRVYYPLNADFRRLTAAAKTGGQRRLVCYNSWIYPRLTDFQDYFCGEGYDFLKVRDYLPKDGSGVFTGGPQLGLQAHTNFILESDWCHSKPETAIPRPRLSKDMFTSDVTGAIARGIVPSINLEIYQDGGVSPVSLDYLRALKAAVS